MTDIAVLLTILVMGTALFCGVFALVMALIVALDN